MEILIWAHAPFFSLSTKKRPRSNNSTAMNTGSNTPWFLILFFFWYGIEDGTQGHSTSELHPQPNFIIYFETRSSYVAEGLTKFLRLVSNLPSSFQPPKYLDHRCVPACNQFFISILPHGPIWLTRLICWRFYSHFYLKLEKVQNVNLCSCFGFLFPVLGMNPGAFYLWATPPAQFYFLFWNRVSLGCWESHYVPEAGLKPAILLS